MSDETGPRGLREWVSWFRSTDHEAVVYAREMLTSVGGVLAVGLLLFAISGVWPPMVAIESSSMEPHMGVGDLVFVMDEHRLAPDYAHAETGVVTYQTGKERGYTKFREPGDVIIYKPNGQGGTPIIHRARFWVSAGENWYDRADPKHIGSADNCKELEHCPAPHGGFITKGDNPATNQQYDQVNGISVGGPVKPEWVVGTAELRIPVLGYVKLCASAGPCPVISTTPGIGPTQTAVSPVSEWEPAEPSAKLVGRAAAATPSGNASAMLSAENTTAATAGRDGTAAAG